MGARSVVGGGEEHALERLELLQRLAGADGHSVQRIGGDDDGHAGLVVEAGLEAVQQRTAAGEGDALLHDVGGQLGRRRSEEHTSELQSLMRISYAVFCLKKKIK